VFGHLALAAAGLVLWISYLAAATVVLVLLTALGVGGS
jgi:hypothetical protein